MHSPECLFCKIINRDITSEILFEDEQIVVLADIHPRAPTHWLIVPKKHIPTINDATATDQLLLGHMILTAKKMAQQADISEEGYRLIFNTNLRGGQTVYHIHLHLLGGRTLNWPPG